MMAFLKIAGFVVALALLLLAGFLAQSPWRVHGGRFVTEYLLLGGTVALVALVILIFSLWV